jgi:hypothetical protein
MELSREQRNSLDEAATRLRAASRWLVAACERAAVPIAPEFEDWPVPGRSAGATARATEGDQADDERLRDMVDAGVAAGCELVSRAPVDPTVRAATSFFASNAGEYLRTSDEVHAARRDPRLSVNASVGELLLPSHTCCAASAMRATSTRPCRRARCPLHSRRLVSVCAKTLQGSASRQTSGVARPAHS